MYRVVEYTIVRGSTVILKGVMQAPHAHAIRTHALRMRVRIAYWQLSQNMLALKGMTLVSTYPNCTHVEANLGKPSVVCIIIPVSTVEPQLLGSLQCKYLC